MINERLEELAKHESVAVIDSLTKNRKTQGYRLLSSALRFAEGGDEVNTTAYLKQAWDYCEDNEMIFPDRVAAEIKTTAIVQDWRVKKEIKKRQSRLERSKCSMGQNKNRNNLLGFYHH